MTTTTAPTPAAVRPDAGERRTLGPAWHRRAGGLHVVKLKGTFYEMGRQHGRLLRDVIPDGPLPYFRRYCDRVLERVGLGRLAPIAGRALRATVGRTIAARYPPFVRETIAGLVEGAGLSEREALEAYTMPDSLLWLASALIHISRCDPAVRHRLALGLGCSSAVAWGPATHDGRLLHARNLDYFGVAPWTRTAAVIFHEPKGGQRYASISAAGIPLGGGTAMNESGLTLAVHQHMFTGRSPSLDGVPIGVVGDIVMREATNLDEAQRILEAHRPIGAWTYLVADGKRRETLCHEQSRDRMVTFRSKPAESTLPYANIFLDPELGATERDLYGSYWRANQGRYERVRDRLAEGRGSLEPESMAAILADTGGDGCRLRRAVGMLLTVASVVFSPEDGRFWVATGGAPVSHNRFEPFDLRAEDHAPEHGALAPVRRDSPEAAAAAAAFDAYRDGYVAYFDRDDLAAARSEVARACRLAPREALYHALSGLLAIAAVDPRPAVEAFDRALALGHPDAERKATFRLWRGRSHDLLGDRSAACSDYRAALGATPVDAAVARAAAHGLARAYTARKARGVSIDFAYADVISP